MKVLVTGGAGFIGSHLADRLLELNHEVVVIDDFSLGKEKNLKDNRSLTIFKKSICDDVSEILKDAKVVFHLAALPSVQFSIKNPVKTNEANVNGTLNLLNLCKKCKVKRFVFSSSSSIYGDQDVLPFVETMNPNPMSPYALQKLAGEYYCKLFTDIYSLETISLRYSNVYGPRQDPEGNYAGLIPKFIKLVNSNVRPVINGDGKQTRDFTYIKDVVEANIIAGFSENREIFGEVFNVGSGKNISVNEITKLIIGNKKLEPIYGSAVMEPRNTLADIKKAKKILNWEPKFSFKEGLRETYKYFS